MLVLNLRYKINELKCKLGCEYEVSLGFPKKMMTLNYTKCKNINIKLIFFLPEIVIGTLY